MKFTPEQIPDLSGRVYLVTGGAAGVGYHTVLNLASHNAKVYIATRSEPKAQKAIDSIQEKIPKPNVVFLKLDLTDLESVKSAAHEFLKKEDKLHGLINNAGIAVTAFDVTKDGYEAQFQTNYLSHWLLTDHLLPIMLRTASQSNRGTVRIVNISSEGHRFFPPTCGINFEDLSLKDPPSTPWTRYGQSKLAVILHSMILNQKYGPGSGNQGENGEIWVASVHPGSVNTSLLANGRGLARILGKIQPLLRAMGYYISPDEGCWTSLFAATSTVFAAENSGSYFMPFGKVGKPSVKAEDIDLARKLWEWTWVELQSKALSKVGEAGKSNLP